MRLIIISGFKISRFHCKVTDTKNVEIWNICWSVSERHLLYYLLSCLDSFLKGEPYVMCCSCVCESHSHTCWQKAIFHLERNYLTLTPHFLKVVKVKNCQWFCSKNKTALNTLAIFTLFMWISNVQPNSVLQCLPDLTNRSGPSQLFVKPGN